MYNIFKNKFLIFYYGALLILLMSWKSTVAAPAVLFRIAYILAVSAPLFFLEKGYTPIVFAIFSIITLNGYSFSYMPTNVLWYCGILILLFMGNIKAIKLGRIFTIPRYLWLLLIDVIIVNLLMNQDIDFVSESFIALVLFLLFVPFNNKQYVSLFYLAFSLISFVLSVFYITAGAQFSDVYADSGIDRALWMDPNYMSTVMGMGVVTSVLALSSRNNNSFIETAFFSICIPLSLAVMILLASRGGLLATAVAMLFVLIFGNVKKSYKIIGSIAIVGFLVLLYNSGYFELLQYRLTDEGNFETASGRFGYWRLKLRNYNDEPILNKVFGLGYRKALVLGSNYEIGFHNDIIAFLVEYGVVGLVLYFVMMINPIKKATSMKKETIACVLYLFTCGLSLEPISSGRLSYFFFYIFILVLSRVKTVDIENDEKNTVHNL